MKTLEQYTPDEIAAEAQRLSTLYGADGGLQEYKLWIAGLRQECLERKAKTMDPTGAVAGWAKQMQLKHEKRVEVLVHGIQYSWPAALGVVRYGEAPDFWPTAFSDEDVIRAKRWLYQNVTPEGVTYLGKE